MNTVSSISLHPHQSEVVFKPNPLNFYLLVSLVLLFTAGPMILGIIGTINDGFSLGFILFFSLAIGTLPFTLIFWYFLNKILKEKIVVNNSGIHFSFEKALVKIKWTECNYFYWEGIRVNMVRAGDKYYRLYELSNDGQMIRFNELVKSSSLRTYSFIPYFGKKSWSKQTYGINLSKKDASRLIELIKKYSGLDPVMKTGLWNSYF